MDLVQAKPCTCPGTGLRSMHWYVTDLFSNAVLVSGAHVVTATSLQTASGSCIVLCSGPGRAMRLDAAGGNKPRPSVTDTLVKLTSCHWYVWVSLRRRHVSSVDSAVGRRYRSQDGLTQKDHAESCVVLVP